MTGSPEVPVQFWPENPEYPVCGSEDCNPVPVLIVSAFEEVFV